MPEKTDGDERTAHKKRTDGCCADTPTATKATLKYIYSGTGHQTPHYTLKTQVNQTAVAPTRRTAARTTLNPKHAGSCRQGVQWA